MRPKARNLEQRTRTSGLLILILTRCYVSVQLQKVTQLFAFYRHCGRTKTISSITLLFYPGLGLALSKYNRILYAGPAWWGYADEADRTRMGRFMRRLLKAGFTSTADADIDASISSAELKLLNRVQSNEFHVLRPLFPALVQHKYSLRRRVHSFMLPFKDDKNFISRVLLKHSSQLI